MPRTVRRARLPIRASSSEGTGCSIRSRRRAASCRLRGGMTPQEYLERVRGLLPALSERAWRTEELRRLSDETFADFQEQGLLRALQLKRYGGYELDPG